MTSHLLFAWISGLGEIVAVVTAAASAISIIWGVVRYLNRRNRARIKRLEAENSEFRLELESLKRAASGADLESARKELAQLATHNQKHQDTISQLTANLESVRGQADQRDDDVGALQRRIDRALKKDGQTWTEKVKANAPEFKKLEPDDRRMPIISVLNLKGGVGKTTIAANLAAALDAQGWRVLLLDLDLQGSLSGLFFADHELVEFDKRQKLLNDFLEASFDAEYPKLTDYVHSVLSGQSGLVPASDSLFYAETNLTIRWLLREGNRDPRFLLRKELHMKRITNQYDIVLMDCPPVFNVCCVNALAAADYVLAPILASLQSTIRVPVLLKRLKEIKENINSDLHIMGIVANRTWRSELTADETNRLTALGDQCKDVWGTQVPLLDSFIRQSTDIRTAEDEHRPLAPSNDTFRLFNDLAKEVAGNLPNFCRPAARDRAAKEVAS